MVLHLVLIFWKIKRHRVYIFGIGDCTQQVTVSASGKLSAVGPAVPISKVFLGAPPGPIVGSLWQNNQLWLINVSYGAFDSIRNHISSGLSKRNVLQTALPMYSSSS